MKLNNIYTTFQGEVNAFGIGMPVIFIRLQGCHLRCYKRTLGSLCDTPEALSKPLTKTKINDIFVEVERVRAETGIQYITLTGGDPLWNNKTELIELFHGLTQRNFAVSVETSGTISWLPYNNIHPDIYWVLDYKLKSSGVKNADKLFLDKKHLDSLGRDDIIKFVVYDDSDFNEFLQVVDDLMTSTDAKISVGAYWGGKLSTFELFNKLKENSLLGCVTINMQTHKMAVSSNYNTKIPKDA
tara:strand:+ start:11767 stop:12492 length:726 start_codon:yes stop_codon:yes gene_type:complete